MQSGFYDGLGIWLGLGDLLEDVRLEETGGGRIMLK
jgi:hypothetical protein